MKNKLLLIIMCVLHVYKAAYSSENDTVVKITQMFLPGVECFEYVISSDSLVVRYSLELDDKKNVYKLFLNREQRRILNEEINKIISLDTLYEKPVIDGYADVVYGSRFMGGSAHRILFFWHTIGNKFLTFLSNLFTNLNLTDMETCYKLFNTHIIKNINLNEKRFGFEPEITSKISKIKNIRIYEVGISYYGRTYQEGKKISWKDGFKAIYCILRYNLFP
jgi:hypothetical protein